MIQVVPHPDPAVEREVETYLAAAADDGPTLVEHDTGWLHVLRSALGHRTYMVVDRAESGSIQGYLPLALVASRMFGRFLVSLPYLNRGGATGVDTAVRQALVDGAVDLADRLDVSYLELRHEEPLQHPRLPQRKEDKALMVLDLPDSLDALWQGLGAKVRNQIRKGDRQGLVAQWGGADLLGAFYRVFAINMRDLGTPVYPRRLFGRILERFAGAAELIVVRHDGRPVAAGMLVHGREDTQVPSASSLRRFNWTNANMWMYHQLLVRAIERGSRQFDFGRSSRDSGTYRFKKQWGATPRPTVWQYHVRHGDIDAVRPDSPRYQRRIAVWRRLPVWVTRLIGPAIVRKIP